MKRKQYLFRADGNARIGAGHLMRCLTIARALSERLGSPEQILFLCADEASGELAASYGFLVHVLHTDFQRMEEELPLARKAISLLGGKVERVETYALPGGDRRALALVRKSRPTPKAYPRQGGKIKKSPL